MLVSASVWPSCHLFVMALLRLPVIQRSFDIVDINRNCLILKQVLIMLASSCSQAVKRPNMCCILISALANFKCLSGSLFHISLCDTARKVMCILYTMHAIRMLQLYSMYAAHRLLTFRG